MKKVLFSLRVLTMMSLILYSFTNKAYAGWFYQTIDGIHYCINYTRYGDNIVADNAQVANPNTGLVGAVNVPSELSFYYSTALFSGILRCPVIDVSGFTDCTGITSVTLPNTVTSIGWGAFQNCVNMTNVNIPYGVNIIETFAFDGCTSLEFPELPESVTKIGSQAFRNCKSFIDIYIPKSVTLLCPEAFGGCSSLKHVYFANNKTYINAWAFQDCSSLTEFVFPDSSSTVPQHVLRNCKKLESVVIGSGATWVSECPFDGCTSLTSVTCKAINPPIVNYDEYFLGICDQAILYVPRESLSKYQFAGGWRTFYKIVAIEDMQEYSISLNQSSATMKKESTLELVATVTPQNANTPKVLWRSDNPSVATVNASGLVTAVGAGEAVITAIAGSAKAYCHVTVMPTLVESISLNADQLAMNAEGNFTLTAIVMPENADNKTLHWSSSNTAAVTIDPNGDVCEIHAIKAGTSIITAHAIDGSNVSASCIVKVLPSSSIIAMLSMRPMELQLRVGETGQIEAKAWPEQTLRWTSSNSNVATVNNGVVTAKGVGNAGITVSTTDGSNLSLTCSLTVLASGGEDGLLGDVNDDGKVNIDDLTALIDYLLRGDASLINMNNADVYTDGQLNIDDVTTLIKYLLSGRD